jgi:hypothetical protein
MVLDGSRLSTRELSVYLDKLPAISGLAAEIANHNGGTYCAGIWWEDIVFGMCWALEGGPLSKRSDPYIAPSWSLASVSGPLRFDKAGSVDLEEIHILDSVVFHDYSV